MIAALAALALVVAPLNLDLPPEIDGAAFATRARLNDAEFNVRAAAVLWDEQGYGAWAT